MKTFKSILLSFIIISCNSKSNKETISSDCKNITPFPIEMICVYSFKNVNYLDTNFIHFGLDSNFPNNILINNDLKYYNNTFFATKELEERYMLETDGDDTLVKTTITYLKGNLYEIDSCMANYYYKKATKIKEDKNINKEIKKMLYNNYYNKYKIYKNYYGERYCKVRILDYTNINFNDSNDIVKLIKMGFSDKEARKIFIEYNQKMQILRENIIIYNDYLETLLTD